MDFVWRPSKDEVGLINQVEDKSYAKESTVDMSVTCQATFYDTMTLGVEVLSTVQQKAGYVFSPHHCGVFVFSLASRRP